MLLVKEKVTLLINSSLADMMLLIIFSVVNVGLLIVFIPTEEALPALTAHNW